MGMSQEERATNEWESYGPGGTAQQKTAALTAVLIENGLAAF
jgi:hypothetical protein